MSAKEVAKIFPEVQPLGNENLGAVAPLGPDFSRQLLVEQSLPGLEKPVHVEFRYWKDRLYAIVVYWGENPAEKVLSVLASLYGEGLGTEPFWRGENVSIATDVRGRWYSFWDNRLSKKVSEAFAAGLRRRSSGGEDAPGRGAAEAAKETRGTAGRKDGDEPSANR